MSYFKIERADYFTEWKKQPTKWEQIKFEAKILPDRVFIHDMLSEDSPYWDDISEEEYDRFIKSM